MYLTEVQLSLNPAAHKVALCILRQKQSMYLCCMNIKTVTLVTTEV